MLSNLVAAGLAVTSGQSIYPSHLVPNHVNARGVPAIVDQFTTDIQSNTTGNVSGIPTGLATATQFYDYTNKRVRIDRDDGTSKMYDYKTLIDPCPTGRPGHGCPSSRPNWPSPQGFKFNTDSIENSCCYVWLVDSDTGEAETMEKFALEDNSKEVGHDARGDHWLSVKKFPFLQTDDWWLGPNNSVVASNSYFIIPGQSPVSGYVQSNGTYTNWVNTVDASKFEHPDSHPTFGKCKECGVDSECPMQECMN